MTVRALFLGEGSSDLGLRFPIQALADSWGVPLTLTAPDLDRLGQGSAGGPLQQRLSRVKDLGGVYDVVFLHRDADNAGVEARKGEIASAVAAVYDTSRTVPIVPIRMTEAWLLLDEEAIRQVSGNPRGRMALDLPTPKEAERIADPKAMLREKLAIASGQSGRRLLTVKKRFDQNRQQLLERLDPGGSVQQLVAWNSFVADMRSACAVEATAVDRVLDA